MPLYTRDGETAAIMALAPVIPVLTVASVDDGVAQAKALVAGGLYAIEVTLRTPVGAGGDPGDRQEPCRTRSLARARSFRSSRSTKRSRPGRGFWSAPALRRRSPRPRRNRRFRSCRAARRRPKPWRCASLASGR